jgi:hypothetical protein
MALQTIINKAESIEFDRRRVIGIQTSRNEITYRNETVTKNPWRMNVNFSALLPYAENRDLIEAIDYLDRRSSEVITFSSNAGLSWLCAYQGSMSAGQLSSLVVSNFVNDQLTIGGLPTVDNNFTSNRVMFKAGDFISVNGFPFPFTVVETVLRGTGSTITVKTHRPNILTSEFVNGNAIKVGNSVEFKMICVNLPTYTIVAGRHIQFNSNFQLIEDVGAA